MILTLRTVPRDDGQFSVVATCQPARPQDPEVVEVFPTRLAAASRICRLALFLKMAYQDELLELETRPNRLRMTFTDSIQIV